MLSNPGFIGDFLRGIFTSLDNLGYFFLGGIFNIFFSIASAELFQGEVFNTFFERIQLILGVFMVFRLSITLLQIIVNPDMYKDKQSGAASLVKRVAVILILLSVIVPITIPEEATKENPLNEKIASNGILFGFLYQIQESIVENNILGQLILGIDTGESGTGLETGGMRNVGQVLTSQVAQSFVTPTLNEGYDTVSEENFEEAAACPDIVRPYYNPLVTSGAIMDHINSTCNSNGEVYAFDYTILGGFIVSVVMTIIVIGFTLDIAVRSIKLGILRLIAPIPIISYISPGQEKDGAFGNWVKTLTSTYLSLFVRLVIIYFGIYLIIILRNGELINTDGLSALAKIFVYIGILIFMKEAPKFFQDMLGLKSDGKLFSGIGTMFGAAALTGGLAGSIATNFRAARDEVLEDGGTKRKAITMGALSGVAGGIGGLFTGGKALMSTDKKQASAVFSAMQKRNATRSAGVSMPRKLITGASALVIGRAPGTKSDTLAEIYSELETKAKANKTMMEEQTKKSSTILGTLKYGPKDTDKIRLNYTNFENRLNNARARGDTLVTVSGYDAGGNVITRDIDIESLDPNVMNNFLEDSISEYGKWQSGLSSDDKDYDKKLAGTVEEYEYAAKTAQMDVDGYDFFGTKGTIGVAKNEQRSINTNRRKDRYRATAREIGASSGKK